MSSRMFRDRHRRTSHSNSPLSSRGGGGGGGGKHAPSRFLWVGNLANGVTKSMLVDVLIRYGELESVSYPPGRSYAFVNYINENDAIAALDSLQGFDLAGFPLRIEFAKADKSSTPSHHDENYSRHRDEPQSSNRGYSSSKRDLRTRHASPEAYHPDSATRTKNGDDHPSEILWIGFPSFLEVDETVLRKAFSPFGEIDKITAFPGRTYAFVQFRNVGSACRAKETLQGRLFGNPRVHICFAKSDTPSTGGGRRGVVGGSNARAGSPDRFSSDFGNVPKGSSVRPPPFSELEYRDPDIVGPTRNEPSRIRGNGGTYEERRSHQGLHRSHEHPSMDQDGNDRFDNFTPETFPGRRRLNDDQWDLPENTNVYPGHKKLKTDPFPEDELPEYPLHTMESSDNPPFPRTFPIFNETGSLHPMAVNPPIEDGRDWRSSRDAFVLHSPSSVSAPDWKRTTPELHRPKPKQDLWKWEGTISKGGTPVCRARCFPVGRVMEIILPEFLDCTARTGLDMLSKHYYQAAGSWVVFFVPASDADMVYYNEFLHYLGDKQRAAVSKLDDRHTLFLVPPSDFSEKVLKVPGKLSISGVVLRLEPPNPTNPPQNETNDIPLMNPYVNTPYPTSETSSGPLHPLSFYPNPSSYEENLSTPSQSSFPGYGQPNQNFFQPARARSPPSPQGYPIQHEHPNPVFDGMSYSGRYAEPSNPEQRLLASSHVGQDDRYFGSSSGSYTTEEYRPVHAVVGEGASHGNQTTQEIQSTGDGENDPQKRLQATLQLAAALLQQIQQGKK